jgi:hypothetical protein
LSVAASPWAGSTRCPDSPWLSSPGRGASRHAPLRSLRDLLALLGRMQGPDRRSDRLG